VIVRCLTRDGSALPTYAQDARSGITAETEFPITPGREYVVFAVTVFLGMAWFYVLDDDGHPWPMWIPAPLTEVTDGAIPPNWRIGYVQFSRDKQHFVLSFPEWASDYAFYERLVDGDETARRVFSVRRAEIEMFHMRLKDAGDAQTN
jgi:hypothetical protein